MLFFFDLFWKVNFWMKNCKIFFDIIFVRFSVVKAIVFDVFFCLVDFCFMYGFSVLVD